MAIMVISFNENDIELLDKAAKEEARSRSSYIQMIFTKYLQNNSSHKKLKSKKEHNNG
jgi:metal-responsive CopG/Arc/MetJ family transcriptional regulator